jgi:hypothetical protein
MTNLISRKHLRTLLDESESQVMECWNKDVIIVYKLKSRADITIVGKAVCFNSDNYSFEDAREEAYENALENLNLYENYLLMLKNAGLIQTDIV